MSRINTNVFVLYGGHIVSAIVVKDGDPVICLEESGCTIEIQEVNVFRTLHGARLALQSRATI